MAMREWTTFKKDYSELFDSPFSFFGSVALNLVKRAFAKPRLEIRSKDGRMVWIEASEGDAGIGIRIYTTQGSVMDVMGMQVPEGGFSSRCKYVDEIKTGEGVNEIEFVLYNRDEWSQRFKAWCLKQGEYPGEKPEKKTSGVVSQ